MRVALLPIFALLAIPANGAEWHQEGSARWIPLPERQSGEAGFSPLSPAVTGIEFTNALDEATSAANRVLENGSGVALGDYDGDGLIDIFLCSLTGHNELFRNRGEWHFENVTQVAGLGGLNIPCRGAVVVDLNGDSRADLLVSTLDQGLRCFMNDGTGHFSDATDSAGLRRPAATTTLALADIDGNGTLDLYVTTYRSDDIRDHARIDIRRVNGRVEVAPWLQDRVALTQTGLLEFGEPDFLYLNDGKGHFTAAPWNTGRFRDENGQVLTAALKDWGLAATFRDVNGDLAPDLYVCNDYWTPDRFWLNDGHGNFTAISTGAWRHSSANSMGVDCADINHDGYIDFFVTDMLDRAGAGQKRQLRAEATNPLDPASIFKCPQYMQNTLFLNRGDGTFAEIAQFAGVEATDWSWQPVFLDVDLDGEEDLIVPAGHTRDVQDADATGRIQSLQHPWPREMEAVAHQQAFAREMLEHNRLYPSAAAPIYAFRNKGNLEFEEMTARWGTGQIGVHQGIAFADLDGDGDLDFVVNNLNGPVGIYRNNSPAPRIAVRLKGLPPNTAAIGAKVTLSGSELPPQTHEVVAGGRYLSSFDTLIVFAAQRPSARFTLEVIWRDGSRTKAKEVLANRLYEVAQRRSPSIE